MPKINLMPKEMAELIAAGEVVERPASVVKELLENSVDAGAKHITLEINRGGILYIRVTDDGCGIASEDVRLAFLRHATSKIKTVADLDGISSLGFRGEALAATSIVSRIELFTKQIDDVFGTHYIIEGGEEKLFEENGCPDGTTVIVRDIFYNTPARMKFLKKDVTEGNSIAAVFERLALSHPEIAFRLIRDGKTAMSTSGDGKLSSAAYSILGREISSTLIPIEYNCDIIVSGLVCKPAYCRKSRSAQYTFLNGRYVQSNTVMAACEQAFKNSAMVGKYPAFVICLNVPVQTVDVNVHPAKIQVRFSDEKKIFDSVYIAVKNAILKGDTRPEIKLPFQREQKVTRMTAEEYRSKTESLPITPIENAYFVKQNTLVKPTETKKDTVVTANEKLVFNSDDTPFFERDDVRSFIAKNNIDISINETEICEKENTVTEKEALPKPKKECPEETLKEIKYIGEVFSTYIIAQMDDAAYFIDKHAAHERINFNRLKKNAKAESQQLLLPVTVHLGREELSAVTDNLDVLTEAGFEIEDFGNSNVLVRAVPAMLKNQDVNDMVVESAKNLVIKGIPESEKLDRIYHTIACKAAIKGGNVTTDTELEALAKEVLSNNDIMYCPHGRPVAFKLSRKELEKQFGRIQ